MISLLFNIKRRTTLLRHTACNKHQISQRLELTFFLSEIIIYLISFRNHNDFMISTWELESYRLNVSSIVYLNSK